uniref:Uncharacterized protein n=1 Tax=Acidianus sulfidivorans JP7 TaxID=619593 RepID=A0A2U9IQ37_9CREN
MLVSIYVKYYINDYTPEDTAYKVCSTCLTLATIGLIYGTHS